jgi:L-threonylcarbamoyladenylate synthase
VLPIRWPQEAPAPPPATLAALDRAIDVLRGGGVVAVPTETVYGLAALATDADAVERIFAAKGRPATNPLIVHVADIAMARSLAADWPAVADRVATALWPGPVTVVVPRGPRIPDVVTAGGATVALRCPADRLTRLLIEKLGAPLAAPSANRSLAVSPTTAAHVVRSLGDRVDLVLDGGPCAHGIESTVLDVTSDPPRVLRAGAASLEDLRAVVPGVLYEALTVTGDAARASPGLASKHYAPRTRVSLAPSGADFVAHVSRARSSSDRVGAIVWSREAARELTSAVARGALSLVTLATLPDDAEGYGRAIFAALHEADEANLDALLVERVPDAPVWWAVADRVRRAAAVEE